MPPELCDISPMLNGSPLRRLMVMLSSAVFISGSAMASSSAPAANAKITKITCVGDSLTEGLGVSKDAAYPARLSDLLKAKGYSIEVVNAGVSGATTAGAAAKVRWALKAKPQLILLALGANDGLRGLKLEETKKNLSEAIDEAKKAEVKLLLAGMKVPPNYGPDYTKKFDELFRKLAKEKKVPLIPFLLVGVGGEPELNQADGIHPNAEGHKKVAETVMKHLEPLL